MNPEKEKRIKGWFENADHDIIMAHKAIDFAPIVLDSACFHCQQTVGKYLKAYIIIQGKDIKKTHNLKFLLDICEEYDYDFENIELKDLNFYSSDIRYPTIH